MKFLASGLNYDQQINRQIFNALLYDYWCSNFLLLGVLRMTAKKLEHDIQNEIRNSLAGQCHLFRANVGTGWTGDIKKLPNGDLLIKNPRPFTTGLPKGFSDTFGWVSVKITPDMLGKTFARFIAGEVKTPKGKPRPEQEKFLDAVNRNGGVGDIWRSVDDANRSLAKAHGINFTE